ncbi:MAG: formate C-acetyltransferase/glycerol dehydratase family glycyl radical enzyme [Bacteroidales bacterium]|nr:formate C-acetyltransferase/glycerol dehydratase family glycyl radical enzyme [Bacteroidales bacterium]
MITKRIENLRHKSLNTRPSISGERAQLMTEFYASEEAKGLSAPLLRAKSFHYLMTNKTIYIGDDELIIGERGPAPQQTPTYPEVCIHTIPDLELINDRPKVKFTVDKQLKKLYSDTLIPFWEGKSSRDKIFKALSKKWLDAYEAGVFTEFLEQRAPGHTVLGDVIYTMGFKDFRKKIQLRLEVLEKSEERTTDPIQYQAKKDELEAMLISLDAVSLFAKRHVEKLEQLLKLETNPKRIAELKKMIQVSKNVPENKPGNTWEALQYYWYVHQGVITELNPWDSFNPGRLDQHLFPFYQKDLNENLQSKAEIIELLQAFWIKFNNHPSPPKMGVTAKESNTFTDFALINIGGLKADGTDAVNEMSYILLDVIEEMRILQPSSMVQLSKHNPDHFIRRAIDIVKTGFGQPSIFNTDAIIQELLYQGKDLIDARKGGASGCVETGAFGTEAYILTGYFNLAKVLEITLNNGTDPLTNKVIGIKSGTAAILKTFDDLMLAYKKQLNHFIDIKIEGNNIIDQIISKELPAPFLSVFIDDCIANAKDYNAGGARYNTRYIQGVGLGSITDSLSALKQNVYDNNTLTLASFVDILNQNFKNNELFRQGLIEEPLKFGNDEDEVDNIAVRVFELFFAAVDNKDSVNGGKFRINLLPTTSHVYFGSKIGALPDGRKAGKPISEGISPVQGADRKGPTAVLKSASKIDHLRTGGTLLNQKFTPQILEDETGQEQVKNLVRTYFQLKGHHIQFNVVTAETLRKAKIEPEKYRDLIVRVAGYSDYFIELTEELQDEIIARTEHQNF